MRGKRPRIGPAPAVLLMAWPALAWAREQPAPYPYDTPPPSQPYPYSAPPDPYPPDQPPSGDSTPPPEEQYSDTDPSALTDFRGALDPYGRWIDDPTYGTVWVPNESAANPSFQPYVTAGRWAYGDEGWTWVSDYPWGGIPFHYGRWVWIGGVGWSWIPGRAYAGAWVDWRVGNGYVGWGPLAPEWAWRNGVAVRMAHRGAPRFYFARQGDLFEPRVGRYVVSGPAYVNRTAPYVNVAPAAYRARSYAGPPPSTIGVAPARVVAAPARNDGLNQARRYARPAPAAPSRPAQAPQAAPRQAPKPAAPTPAPASSPRNAPPPARRVQ